MLSSSIEATGGVINLQAITNRQLDPLIPGGLALLNYVDATLSGTNVTAAREAVAATLGKSAAVDAAAVIGNFEMMNRIADGVGMPVGGGTRNRMRRTIEDLGLDQFPHA